MPQRRCSKGSEPCRLLEDLRETLRKTHILQPQRLFEQGRYFFVPESCDAAADAGDIEELLRMILGKRDEIIHIRFYGLHAALHRRDGVALTSETDSAAHHGTEKSEGGISRATAMDAGKVAALCKRLHKAPYVKSEIM